MANHNKEKSPSIPTNTKEKTKAEHLMREDQVKRIGLVQCISGIDDSALRYLILSMNSVQSAFQFEFVPFDDQDGFLRPLLANATVDRPTSNEMLKFHARQTRHFQEMAKSYEQQGESPHCFQVISTAKFSDSYFYTSNGLVSVIALGNWKRSMAPPSILEFIQVLVLQNALFILCPGLETHLGTRGCIKDFSAQLSDARQKVLVGYLCHECEYIISEHGYPGLADELRPLLSKSWLGNSADPTSPAAIISKLKRDLFVTKGLKPNLLELTRMTAIQEGVKLPAAIAAVVIAAILIAIFGVVTEVHLTEPATNLSPTPTSIHGVIKTSPNPSSTSIHSAFQATPTPSQGKP